MRVFVALFGLFCLGLAGLNLYIYLQTHQWLNLVAALVVAGVGLYDIYTSTK